MIFRYETIFVFTHNLIVTLIWSLLSRKKIVFFTTLSRGQIRLMLALISIALSANSSATI